MGDLGRFENLESLLIENQKKLTGINLGPNPKLLDMKILTCKTLEKIAGIDSLKKLSKLRVYDTAIDYEKFVEAPMPSSLRTFAFYTGKSKRDSEIRLDLGKRGFLEFSKD